MMCSFCKMKTSINVSLKCPLIERVMQVKKFVFQLCFDWLGTILFCSMNILSNNNQNSNLSSAKTLAKSRTWKNRFSENSQFCANSVAKCIAKASKLMSVKYFSSERSFVYEIGEIKMPFFANPLQRKKQLWFACIVRIPIRFQNVCRHWFVIANTKEIVVPFSPHYIVEHVY